MVGFVSVVAFCGLLWSFVTFRCFCMMVCGAKCNFYGYCRILWYLWQLWHLWWYSWVAVHFEFFSGDFHTISWFSAKFGCFGWNMIFWFGPKRISWLFRWFQFGFEFWLDHFCFSVHLAALEGAMPNLQVKKFAGEKAPCQICRKKISRWEDAIATLPVKRFFKVRRCYRKSAGKKHVQGDKVPSQIWR